MSIFQLIENEEYDEIRDEVVNLDLEAVDEGGDTPLHYAIRNEDYELLDIILAYVPDLDVENLDGDSALHIAVQNGNSELVRVLIDYGASTDVKDNNKRTPEKLAGQLGEGVIYTILRGTDDDEEYSGRVEKIRRHVEYV